MVWMPQHVDNTAMDREFREEVLAGLAELRTSMKSIIGNGQPGRLQVVETTVLEHSKVINGIVGGYKMFAIVGVCFGIVGSLAAVVAMVMKIRYHV